MGSKRGIKCDLMSSFPTASFVLSFIVEEALNLNIFTPPGSITFVILGKSKKGTFRRSYAQAKKTMPAQNKLH